MSSDSQQSSKKPLNELVEAYGCYDTSKDDVKAEAYQAFWHGIHSFAEANHLQAREVAAYVRREYYRRVSKEDKRKGNK